MHAHRRDAVRHPEFRSWLERLLGSDEQFAVSDHVLSGFLRIVTSPRIWVPPSTLVEALAFVQQVRGRLNCTVVSPGPRHWDIFERLCRAADARGNLIPDAYLAALAIESGCEWITTDRDFARFPGLRWRHPLETV